MKSPFIYKTIISSCLVAFALWMPGRAQTSWDFVPIGPDNIKSANAVSFYSIPFSVIQTSKGYQNIAPGSYNVPGFTFRYLFFLGMTTDRPEGSEWWGQAERYYSNQSRLFIGDKLGSIEVVYMDSTHDIIPVIFGMNCWNYELFTPVKPEETYLNTYYDSPYPEPFASDKNAKKLLDESLHLMVNDAVKGAKYIFGVETKNKAIRQVNLYRTDFRFAGPYITAITGVKPDAVKGDNASQWKAFDETYFTRQKYYPSMDKLARRLYQFDDELPASDPVSIPQGYDGPKVRFTGNGMAEIFTNVYLHNLDDMRKNKVDEQGGMHTSSKGSPNFSTYVGIGTFKVSVGSYSSHVWSRDLGRCMMEVIESGEVQRSVKAANEALRLLYDPSSRYSHPNWKRIANAYELNNDGLWRSVGGKENDGHGAMMLFLYKLVQHHCVDATWVKDNWKALCDAAEWYCWQMDNPQQSGFDGVLASESEASTQLYGTYDLFSNYFAFYGLKAFAKIAAQIGDKTKEDRWNQYAEKLHQGIMDRFTTDHPRYGKIFVDIIYDCWTWEYKRFVPLFLATDLVSYDLATQDPDLYEICYHTYLAQKEDYFSYAAGRQMGYGQGYITQAAILLDEPDDMKGYLERAAAFCYHHSDYNYIVPEGVIVHPSGRFWFRNSDLGNCVQQAEIVKAARLLIGLDDLDPVHGLTVIPRLPSTWKTINVQDYPIVAVDKEGNTIRTTINYDYERTENGFHFTMKPAETIRIARIRLGPFASQDVKISGGKYPVAIQKIRNQFFVNIDFNGHYPANINLTATCTLPVYEY